MNLYMQVLNFFILEFWLTFESRKHTDREYDKDKIINDLVKLGSIVVENG